MSKTLRILFIALSLVGCSFNQVDELVPFTSDGCSVFPEGTRKQQNLWRACCFEHDKRYWLGGSYEERVQADQALKSCVEKVGEEAIAKLMLAGVRVGGSPYWPTSYRWGYGWNYPRGYQKPTTSEIARAEALLKTYQETQRRVNAEKPSSKTN